MYCTCYCGNAYFGYDSVHNADNTVNNYYFDGIKKSHVNFSSNNDNTIHDDDNVDINTNANDTYNNAYITC